MRLFRGKPRPHRPRRLMWEDDGISVPWLSALVAVYLVAMLNGGFWRAVTALVPLDGAPAVLFYAALFAALASVYALVLNLIALRYVGKLLLIVCVLSASLGAYLLDTSGVAMNASSSASLSASASASASAHAFGSVADEALGGHSALRLAAQDYLSVAALWKIGALGVLPAGLIAWVRIGRRYFLREVWRRARFCLLCLVIAACAVGVQYRQIPAFFKAQPDIVVLLNPFNACAVLVSLTMEKVSGTRSVAPNSSSGSAR